MAVFIFATIVVGLLGIWSTYSRAIGKARSVLVATYLGEQIMENCIAVKYAGIDAFAASYATPQPITTRAKMRAGVIVTEYLVSVAVQNFSPDVKYVTVTIQWTENAAKGSTERDLEFHTMLNRRG